MNFEIERQDRFRIVSACRRLQSGSEYVERFWGLRGLLLGFGRGGSSFGRVGGVDSCPVCAAGLLLPHSSVSSFFRSYSSSCCANSIAAGDN